MRCRTSAVSCRYEAVSPSTAGPLVVGRGTFVSCEVNIITNLRLKMSSCMRENVCIRGRK